MEFKPRHLTAAVATLKKLTHKVYSAYFRMKEPSDIRFVAGQYGSFFIAPKIRRNFSFTTPPTDASQFGICADVTPMGPGSVWLMNLKKGDVIEFLGPLGRFTVDKTTTMPKVFVATGTGIAPIRSMVRDCMDTMLTAKLALYWGLRYEDDIFWNDEFQALALNNPQFRYFLTLSRSSHNWAGEQGRVTEHIISHEKDLTKNEYYLCGNRPITDDIQNRLFKHGVPENQIKMELFY